MSAAPVVIPTNDREFTQNTIADESWLDQKFRWWARPAHPNFDQSA